MHPCPYETLGLKRSVADKQIHEQFKKLIQTEHIDKHREAIFRNPEKRDEVLRRNEDLHRAYDVLRNRSTREYFDTCYKSLGLEVAWTYYYDNKDKQCQGDSTNHGKCRKEKDHNKLVESEKAKMLKVQFETVLQQQKLMTNNQKDTHSQNENTIMQDVLSQIKEARETVKDIAENVGNKWQSISVECESLKEISYKLQQHKTAEQSVLRKNFQKVLNSLSELQQTSSNLNQEVRIKINSVAENSTTLHDKMHNKLKAADELGKKINDFQEKIKIANERCSKQATAALLELKASMSVENYEQKYQQLTKAFDDLSFTWKSQTEHFEAMRLEKDSSLAQKDLQIQSLVTEVSSQNSTIKNFQTEHNQFAIEKKASEMEIERLLVKNLQLLNELDSQKLKEKELTTACARLEEEVQHLKLESDSKFKSMEEEAWRKDSRILEIENERNRILNAQTASNVEIFRLIDQNSSLKEELESFKLKPNDIDISANWNKLLKEKVASLASSNLEISRKYNLCRDALNSSQSEVLRLTDLNCDQSAALAEHDLPFGNIDLQVATEDAIVCPGVHENKLELTRVLDIPTTSSKIGKLSDSLKHVRREFRKLKQSIRNEKKNNTRGKNTNTGISAPNEPHINAKYQPQSTSKIKKSRHQESNSKPENSECASLHKRRVWHCGLCNLNFAYDSCYFRHLKHTHKEPDKKHKCKFCLKEFNRKDNFQRHINLHTIPNTTISQKKSIPESVLAEAKTTE